MLEKKYGAWHGGPESAGFKGYWNQAVPAMALVLVSPVLVEMSCFRQIQPRTGEEFIPNHYWVFKVTQQWKTEETEERGVAFEFRAQAMDHRDRNWSTDLT